MSDNLEFSRFSTVVFYFQCIVCYVKQFYIFLFKIVYETFSIWKIQIDDLNTDVFTRVGRLTTHDAALPWI